MWDTNTRQTGQTVPNVLFDSNSVSPRSNSVSPRPNNTLPNSARVPIPSILRHSESIPHCPSSASYFRDSASPCSQRAAKRNKFIVFFI